MAGPVLRPYGDRALLVECESGDDVLALAARILAAGLPGLVDVIPGACTVLARFADPASLTSAHPRLSVLADQPTSAIHGPRTEVVLDVVYDGADLEEVAEIAKMDPAEVVDAHTGSPWRVGFVGFAPGFAYLVGGDPRLNVPRRAEPRTKVPAGSVALAGGYSGVYPRESPGGWQLIGRTGAALWDLDLPNPALLTPGMWVRFRAVNQP